MNILVRFTRNQAFFTQDSIPDKTMKIENAFSAKRITSQEALIQKRQLFKTIDFHQALYGAAKLLFRFCIGNFSILIVVIIGFIAIGNFKNREDSIYNMLNSWRLTILFCNGFLITIPILFMELSIFVSTIIKGKTMKDDVREYLMM
jgi:flagellar biosynthesis component FlhA